MGLQQLQNTKQNFAPMILLTLAICICRSSQFCFLLDNISTYAHTIGCLPLTKLLHFPQSVLVHAFLTFMKHTIFHNVKEFRKMLWGFKYLFKLLIQDFLLQVYCVKAGVTVDFLWAQCKCIPAFHRCLSAQIKSMYTFSSTDPYIQL